MSRRRRYSIGYYDCPEGVFQRKMLGEECSSIARLASATDSVLSIFRI